MHENSELKTQAIFSCRTAQ